MAKVDRLLNIVAALQASSVPLTAEEIRERVPGYESHSDDTFRRTFERDKDELRQAGVPVETVMVAGRVRKWKGRLVDVNLGRLRREIEATRDHLFAASGVAKDLFRAP